MPANSITLAEAFGKIIGSAEVDDGKGLKKLSDISAADHPALWADAAGKAIGTTVSSAIAESVKQTVSGMEPDAALGVSLDTAVSAARTIMPSHVVLDHPVQHLVVNNQWKWKHLEEYEQVLKMMSEEITFYVRAQGATGPLNVGKILHVMDDAAVRGCKKYVKKGKKQPFRIHYADLQKAAIGISNAVTAQIGVVTADVYTAILDAVPSA